jgi:uncharacterized protein
MAGAHAPFSQEEMMNVQRFLEQIPEFEAQQADRCDERGIDVQNFGLSHVAFRCRTWNEYVALRDDIEAYCFANLENVWNGRPVSKLLLAVPIELEGGRTLSLIQLIPPFHQRICRMGLEHVGYVVGSQFEEFATAFKPVLTGRQFQSPACEPVFARFADYTQVKFYEESLFDVCIREGSQFADFRHARWSPLDPDAGPYVEDCSVK